MNTNSNEQERAAFEAWWESERRKTFPEHFPLEKLAIWMSVYKHDAWAGWQARAALSQDREDSERLDWLLRKLPGDAIRYCVGVLDDTADVEKFRAAIDHARRIEGEL